MTVKRIVPNFRMANPEEAKAFYEGVFGLDIAMNLGWIITFSSDQPTTPQISIASEGGSGTQVPAVSIEVDDVDEAYRKAREFGADIVYELTDEAWGVRRFYVRDPGGMLLNVLAHLS